MPKLTLQMKPGPDLRPLRLELIRIGRFIRHAFTRRPLAGLALSFLILVGVIYQFSAHTVTIYVDGVPEQTVRTFSRTVDEVLEELAVSLHPRDRVSPTGATLLSPETRVDIERAFPVLVLADGEVREIWSPSAGVEEFLAGEGYVLGPDDRVEPVELSEIYPGVELKIVRVEKLYRRQQAVVPYQEISRGNPGLDRGLTRVVSGGQEGLQDELVEITYEDGREVSREVVKTAVLNEPVTRVVEYGENTRLERGGRVVNFDRAMIMTATSYCPGTPGSGCPLDHRGHAFCTGPYNNGYTYTGRRTVQGLGTLDSPRIVAVDPRVIPLGTMLYVDDIPGIGRIGFAVAADIGGAIKGNRIDILYDKHSDVARFGLRRGVRVYVLTGY